MLCPTCGATQKGCVCSPAHERAHITVPGQAKRAQEAARAATENSVVLLDFLREFVSSAPPAKVTSAGIGQTGARPPALAAASGGAGGTLWAPPVASERVPFVPFKALAIVPLPAAGPVASPIERTSDHPSSSTTRSLNELLPAEPPKRRGPRRWKRSAVLGSSVAAVR